MSDRDTWPERITVPTLKDCLESLRWINECLSKESTRQKRAAERVAMARAQVAAAIEALKQK